MEQAEQATVGERALQSTCKRARDGLPHRRVRKVGENAVGETAELQLAGTDEADQRVLGTRKRGRERALGGGARIVASSGVMAPEVRPHPIRQTTTPAPARGGGSPPPSWSLAPAAANAPASLVLFQVVSIRPSERWMWETTLPMPCRPASHSPSLGSTPQRQQLATRAPRPARRRHPTRQTPRPAPARASREGWRSSGRPWRRLRLRQTHRRRGRRLEWAACCRRTASPSDRSSSWRWSRDRVGAPAIDVLQRLACGPSNGARSAG